MAKANATAPKAAPKAAKAKAPKQPETKSQLMAAIAETADISKPQAKAAVEALLGFAYKGAKGPKGFTIPGLGKLIKVQRKARMGRNPATGEQIKIKAKTDVKFRLSKVAKEAVLGKKI